MQYSTHTLLFLLCLISLLTACDQKSTASKDGNVAQLFSSLPADYMEFDAAQKTALLKSAETQDRDISPTNINGNDWKVDALDEAQKFMSLRTQGKGAGKVYELAQISQGAKGRIVSVAQTEWGADCDLTQLKVLSEQGDKWTDITGKAFPKLSLSAYMDDEFDPAQIPAKLQEAPSFYIKLLPGGKEIYVILDDCLEKGWREEDPKVVDYVFEHWKYERIHLSWNGESFEISKKDEMDAS